MVWFVIIADFTKMGKAISQKNTDDFRRLIVNILGIYFQTYYYNLYVYLIFI